MITASQPCDCWKCYRARGVQPWHMVLCPVCGNKRCPKASDHDLACTGSNEPGQAGSVYGEPRSGAVKCPCGNADTVATGAVWKCLECGRTLHADGTVYAPVATDRALLRALVDALPRCRRCLIDCGLYSVPATRRHGSVHDPYDPVCDDHACVGCTDLPYATALREALDALEPL